jgi:mannose-1-phosphate guanylyltransferase
LYGGHFVRHFLVRRRESIHGRFDDRYQYGHKMRTITQAFVLGAGLGTRLRPLTDDLPKPLIPIFQKPLITFALDHLIEVGVERFIINTHRLPKSFEPLFPANRYAGRSVKLVNEPVLLDTGGGIKNVQSFLGTKHFIVYSGDILTDVDLEPLIEEHFRAQNDVTLGLRRDTGLGAGVVARNGRIVAISNESNPTENFDYANISVWNPEIFRRILPNQKISFIPIVTKWIGEGGKIGGFVLNERKWFNIGSRSDYLEVHRIISNEHWKPHYLKLPQWPEQVAASAMVDPTAKLCGYSVVGADCRVGSEAILENTILWPGSQIASRSDLRDCIVRSGKQADGIHRHADI